MPIVSQAQWGKFGADPKLRPLLHKWQHEAPVKFSNLPVHVKNSPAQEVTSAKLPAEQPKPVAQHLARGPKK